MIYYLLFMLSLMTSISCSKSIPTDTLAKHYTYLALGDSYTIGTGISSSNNFPNQLIDTLLNYNFENIDFEISAKNGWTTTNLEASFSGDFALKTYDIVTLLIGVNNQFQGKSIESYANEYSLILERAIAFANGNSENVIVLSIPDYSVTPFVSGNKKAKVAAEIALFNERKKAITQARNVKFIDITPLTQKANSDSSLLANDNLHPSAKLYSQWISEMIGDAVTILK